MNNRLPMFRLPTEILAIVFKNLEEEQRFDEYASNDVPACVVVTQVCRYWRSVAHAYPALWTFIRSSSPRWLAIMLDKSRNLPLVVMYKSPIPLHDCLELILLHLPRIKFLRFHPLQADCDRIIQLLSSQPAPLLETFECFNLTTSFGFPVTKLIPNDIFQGQAPRLRSVKLTSPDIDWTAHFSGIRTLSLENFYLTLSQFLPALRRMPTLEHLELERFRIEDEETILLETVPLPRLKSIALGDSCIGDAVSLFKQLVLPVDVKISLCIRHFDDHQDISDLFVAMDMHPGGSSSIIRSMRVIRHHFDYSNLCVQFSTSPAMNPVDLWDCADLWNPSDDDIRLSVEFQSETHSLIHTPDPIIIFDICRMVTRVTQDRIQSLYLLGFQFPYRDFWRAGSACLPDLEFIHLEGIHTGGLIAALKITEDEQILDILYPSLRVLEVKDACFWEKDEETLQDIMMMRAKHGVGIHILRLAYCRKLRVNQVQRFREVIATVVWDEHQDLEDYSSDAKSSSLEEIGEYGDDAESPGYCPLSPPQVDYT